LLVLSLFGPEIAAYMGVKFVCWLVELGFSTLTAYLANKAFDPSASDSHIFWLENYPDLWKNY
jgi:hypothetical protein